MPDSWSVDACSWNPNLTVAVSPLSSKDKDGLYSRRSLSEYLLNELRLRKNMFGGLTNNLSTLAFTRRGLGQSETKRDIDTELEYPETGSLTPKLFRQYFERHPVANRVVRALPEESWKLLPSLFEDEDVDTETEFEKAWQEVSSILNGNSRFRSRENEASTVWEYLKRADILSGIGYYGVIFLGFDDGLPLDQPVEPSPDRNLLFMRAFDQYDVDIVEYEKRESSPRFGLPVTYTIKFFNVEDIGGIEAVAAPNNATVKVHWTRVIHVADNVESNEVFGAPRMRSVWNNLQDLRKLYGGSAEMYWKGAMPGVVFEIDPALAVELASGAIPFDQAEFKEDMENYMENLQRYLVVQGMKANSLAPQVSDPSPQIDAQIDAICIQLGIPKRIFVGSERGELASTQDLNYWNSRLKLRQETYITPRIIVPLVDRLILVGVLPEPKQYFAVWPDLEVKSDVDRAEIGLANTKSLVGYAKVPDTRSVMAPRDFLTRILGLSLEEAEAVLEAADNFSVPTEESVGAVRSESLGSSL